MRARYKWSGGTGLVALGDDASLRDVVEELKKKTLLSDFDIKFGPPAAMKTVDMMEMDQPAKLLGLHGETLTIVPNDVRPLPIAVHSGVGSCPLQRLGRQNAEPQDVNVPWGERDGTLCKSMLPVVLSTPINREIVLRVMPSDNSCLFTAFGGALPQQVPPSRLRGMMADYIQQHLDVYSEAILGISPDQYCRSIVDPDRWGGGIELSILSSIFDIKICTYDVETRNLISFGEGKRDLCVLVYSGIHYDRIAFSYSEHPYNEPTLPPEMDRTTWPVEDEEILVKAKELVERLHAAHYFTNMDGLVLKCDVAGCGWIGSGQAEGQRHAEQTGHTQLSEIVDSDADTVRKCNIKGCEFIGQGETAARQHSQDTGHKAYSVIEDW